MKIVHISDTHGFEKDLYVGSGDVLVCSGDFSHNEYSFFKFTTWFKNQDFKHKILVAGNHDGMLEKFRGKDLLIGDNIIYLEDEEIIIDGIKFYGTPWSPVFFNWHFMQTEEKLELIWDMIPDDVNVLITHTPAYGILDTAPIYDRKSKMIIHDSSQHNGSTTLSERLKVLEELKVHLFGHIHESYGIYDNGKYKSFNSSIYERGKKLKKAQEIIL